MSIIHIAKRKRYTAISNTVLEDRRLGLKPRCLLMYLLSKPDDWVANVKELVHYAGPDGETAVRSALAELVKYGYATFERGRSHGGVFAKGGWTIYEDPVTPPAPAETEPPPTDPPEVKVSHNDPRVENPHVAEPHVVEPQEDNHHAYLLLNLVNTEVSKTEKEEPSQTLPERQGLENGEAVYQGEGETETEAPHASTEDIRALLGALYDIPPRLRETAALFHDAVVDVLTQRYPSWPVEREYPVANRGDGRTGHIDILVHTTPPIGIELDYVSTRAKSLVKLRQVDGWRIVGLRQAHEAPHRVDDIFFVGAKRAFKGVAHSAAAQSVLDHLNTVTGHSFKTVTHIEACLNRGITVEECIKVIDWWHTVRRKDQPELVHKYLDYETPFRPTKFDKYLQQALSEEKRPVAPLQIARVPLPVPAALPELRERTAAEEAEARAALRAIFATVGITPKPVVAGLAPLGAVLVASEVATKPEDDEAAHQRALAQCQQLLQEQA